MAYRQTRSREVTASAPEHDLKSNQAGDKNNNNDIACLYQLHASGHVGLIQVISHQAATCDEEDCANQKQNTGEDEGGTEFRGGFDVQRGSSS